MGNLWASLLAGNTARSVALYLFIAISIGNLLCELGNLLAIRLGFENHYFNKWFLIVGLLGMFGFSFSLLRRRNNHNKAAVDRLGDKDGK